jgi:hypothetical protein
MTDRGYGKAGLSKGSPAPVTAIAATQAPAPRPLSVMAVLDAATHSAAAAAGSKAGGMDRPVGAGR